MLPASAGGSHVNAMLPPAPDDDEAPLVTADDELELELLLDDPPCAPPAPPPPVLAVPPELAPFVVPSHPLFIDKARTAVHADVVTRRAMKYLQERILHDFARSPCQKTRFTGPDA